MTSSNEPLKKADVKAALATKDSQGRRRLMSSVAGACPRSPSSIHAYRARMLYTVMKVRCVLQCNCSIQQAQSCLEEVSRSDAGVCSLQVTVQAAIQLSRF